MIQITDKALCNGCHVCANICPKRCITMQEDAEGFRYPVVDFSQCVDCRLCENTCPVLHTKEIKTVPRAYAAYNLDTKVRANSSSGGIFYLLAKYVLEQGGLVAGAAFCQDFSVEHILVDRLSDLPKLMTSKYVQSVVGTIHKDVKQALDSGKIVLYTGTPCQNEALQFYLGKPYAHLYLQDIVCHGVPSPKIWQMYLSFCGISKINSINFRAKAPSWKNFALSINDEQVNSHREDLFMQSFLSNLNLRPSCYHCKFKKIHRSSDITLADFWGCSGISDIQDMDDDGGLSLVITHSEKGERLMEAISDSVVKRPVDMQKAIQNNASYMSSVKKPVVRGLFMHHISPRNFAHKVAFYGDNGVLQRIKGKAKDLLKKLLHR